MELAAQLADMSNREIGEHYGIGATAVAANHGRLAVRPEVLKVVETLAGQLRKKKRKCSMAVCPIDEPMATFQFGDR